MKESNLQLSNPNNEKIVCFISKIPKMVKTYLKMKLKEIPSIKFLFPESFSKENILSIVPQAEILIGWRPSKDILMAAKKMKLFINPGAGVHHLLDLFKELNQKREILLINGHGNSYFVAQHSVALLLTLMNKTIPHHIWMREGKWRTGDEEGASIPLRNLKVGLLGYGAINQKVHRMLAGFDVDFCLLRKYWIKQVEPFSTEVKKFEPDQLHQFLKEIQILIIAVPVTPKTKGMIKQKELELLGPNGIVINVSRGDIIDEKSLFYALKDGVITGAAIDVWYNYHPEAVKDDRKYPYKFPFHTLDNIILSPHRAYSPFLDLKRWDEVIENVSRFALGSKIFLNVVNLEEGY